MSTANSVTSGLDCSSPESIMDPTNLTPAGDQYSLGCVLYYMLTGQYPFPDGSAAEKMMAHQFKEPTPIGQLNPEVSPSLVAIVERLTKKSPEARFGGAGEIIEALRPFTQLSNIMQRPKPRSLPSRETTPATPKVALPAAVPEGLKSLAGANMPGAKPSVSVSAPTPKPQTLGTLPTRSSLKGAAAPVPAPAPVPQPAEIVDENGDRVVPGVSRTAANACHGKNSSVRSASRLRPSRLAVSSILWPPGYGCFSEIRSQKDLDKAGQGSSLFSFL